MATDEKSILCPKCGNDTFVIREIVLRGFGVGCPKCGEGKIFGPGISARSIVSILKGEGWS
jgi:predicted nucleic-acid-binding Zn-ribbon protein